jgi:hypothetical protein
VPIEDYSEEVQEALSKIHADARNVLVLAMDLGLQRGISLEYLERGAINMANTCIVAEPWSEPELNAYCGVGAVPSRGRIAGETRRLNALHDEAHREIANAAQSHAEYIAQLRRTLWATKGNSVQVLARERGVSGLGPKWKIIARLCAGAPFEMTLRRERYRVTTDVGDPPKWAVPYVGDVPADACGAQPYGRGR